jgi:outer membrane protein assembly factor BamD
MFKKFLTFFLILFLFACSNTNSDKKILKNQNFDIKYNEALLDLKNKNYYIAAEKFENISLDFNKSNDKVVILSAFSYYKAKKYDESLNLIEFFKKKFPMHNNIVYIKYLEILNYYDRMKNIGKSTDIAKKTYYLCGDFLVLYKDSIYYSDISLKKEMAKNYIVANELEVIRYNLSKSNFVSALQRLDDIKNNYKDNIYKDEIYFSIDNSEPIMLSSVNYGGRYVITEGIVDSNNDVTHALKIWHMGYSENHFHGKITVKFLR